MKSETNSENSHACSFANGGLTGFQEDFMQGSYYDIEKNHLILLLEKLAW